MRSSRCDSADATQLNQLGSNTFHTLDCAHHVPASASGSHVKWTCLSLKAASSCMKSS
jgi:hypothetical protein